MTRPQPGRARRIQKCIHTRPIAPACCQTSTLLGLDSQMLLRSMDITKARRQLTTRADTPCQVGKVPLRLALRSWVCSIHLATKRASILAHQNSDFSAKWLNAPPLAILITGFSQRAVASSLLPFFQNFLHQERIAVPAMRQKAQVHNCPNAHPKAGTKTKANTLERNNDAPGYR